MQSLPGLMGASYLASRDAGGSLTRDRDLYSNLNTSLDFAAAFAIFFLTPTRKTAPTNEDAPEARHCAFRNWIIEGAKTMSLKRLHPFTVGLALAALMTIAPAVLGQVTTTNTQATQNQSMTARSVPSGSKMKFRGVVINRDADVFTIRDRSRADYQV